MNPDLITQCPGIPPTVKADPPVFSSQAGLATFRKGLS